jgi:hypothetical protein
VADVDASLVQKIFHIPEQKWKPNIYHDGQANDLWARLEVAKRAARCHTATQIARLNKFSSDSAALNLALILGHEHLIRPSTPAFMKMFGA